MKKNMKKLTSMALAAAMALSLMMPAWASESRAEQEELENISDSLAMQEFSMTEIERLDLLKEMSVQELQEDGYSEEDIEEIQNFSYEDALYERAQLPKETLRSFGYTDEEIDVLKEYDGGALTADSEMMALVPTCTSTIEFVSSTSKKIQYKYSWEWNMIPLFVRTDGVASQWQTIDPNAYYLDGVSTSSVAYVKYVNGNYSQLATVQPTADDYYCSVECKFPMTLSAMDGYWAKSGELYNTVSIPSGSTATISYLKVLTTYGHAKLTAEVSFSFATSGLSIGVTPESSVTEEAPQSVIIYRSGTIKNLST